MSLAFDPEVTLLPALLVSSWEGNDHREQPTIQGWPVTTQWPSPSLLISCLSSVWLESSSSFTLSKLCQSSVTTYLRTLFRLHFTTGCTLLQFCATVHDSFSFVPRAIIARAFCCQSRVHQYLPIRRRVDCRLRNGEPSVWAFSWEIFVQRRHRREIALEWTDGVTSGTGEERPLRIEKWTLW